MLFDFVKKEISSKGCVWKIMTTFAISKPNISTTMKDRIFALMKELGMKPTTFANTIGISGATLSSIKSQRTQPTLLIVNQIKAKFPDVNMNWLVSGEGSMFVNGDDHKSPLQEQQPQLFPVNDTDENSAEEEVAPQKTVTKKKRELPPPPEEKIVMPDVDDQLNHFQQPSPQKPSLGKQAAERQTRRADEHPVPEPEIPQETDRAQTLTIEADVKPRNPAAAVTMDNDNGNAAQPSGPRREVKQVILLYNDGTYDMMTK